MFDYVRALEPYYSEEELILDIKGTFNSAPNSDVQQLLNVSKPTATRILSSLSDYLVITGTRGKGTYYSLKGLTIGSPNMRYRKSLMSIRFATTTVSTIIASINVLRPSSSKPERVILISPFLSPFCANSFPDARRL